MKLKKSFNITIALMMGFAVCVALCGCASGGTAASSETVRIEQGDYYLNGNKDEQYITVYANNTLQFLGSDTEEFVNWLYLPQKEGFESKAEFNEIITETVETLSAPVSYKSVDYRDSKGDEIYIILNEIDGGILAFTYADDSQGKSLICGSGEYLREYILKQ